jgi:hypothetical protein
VSAEDVKARPTLSDLNFVAALQWSDCSRARHNINFTLKFRLYRGDALSTDQ